MTRWWGLLVALPVWLVAHSGAEQPPASMSANDRRLIEPTLPLVPERPSDAPGGKAFLESTINLSKTARERAAVAELTRGNFPDALRRLVPIRLSVRRDAFHVSHAVVWVMPHYLAVGSNADYEFMPLDYPSAVRVADALGFVLPTPRLVDEIYRQATVKLAPEPLPPGPAMTTSPYYMRHNAIVTTSIADSNARVVLGEPTSVREEFELVAGYKKDVVLSNILNRRAGRLAIYGWHRLDGRPIQPLSTAHHALYADYSHGIRLVSQLALVDGRWVSLLDLLGDAEAAELVSGEGRLERLERMTALKTH